MKPFYLILLAMFLSSCSAQYHLNKAEKKGAKLGTEVIYKYITEYDTITNEIKVIDSIPYSVTKIEYVPKTRYEIKFDNKRFKDSLNFIRKSYKDSVRLQIKEVRIESKADVKKTKIESKSSPFLRFVGRMWWIFIIFGIAIGAYIRKYLPF
ncbi:MAG: hypothetical protein GTN59_07625 [Candidatus Dadabacteria bacterium]|nr:hypothetical protein [Candidatus Dadabacteria bacterium]